VGLSNVDLYVSLTNITPSALNGQTFVFMRGANAQDPKAFHQVGSTTGRNRRHHDQRTAGWQRRTAVPVHGNHFDGQVKPPSRARMRIDRNNSMEKSALCMTISS
jgi:hypothetical protein